MKDDDAQVGRILARREMLALLGATGAMLAGLPARSGAQAIPACVVTPAQMDGPFFTDVRLNRADIRSDPTDKSVREGAPLTLALRVATVGAAGCTALRGAMVDVWHCDAVGAYSDSDQATAGKKFLRGYQLTDANGVARFTTIYPGWYPGRTVHIHVKVHVGGTVVHTGQLYFNDTVTDAVYRKAPYRARGARTTRNASDSIFRNGGSRSQVKTAGDGKGGYVGRITMGISR
jgi:protocatechuate 3,4-dioxygenase beta subunit